MVNVCAFFFKWLAGVCWLELGFSTVLQSKIYQLVCVFRENYDSLMAATWKIN